MEDINVQIIDMDVMIPEHVIKNQDGSYTIFLNAKYNQEHQLQSYLHAIEHINNGDFDREYGDVQEIESETHGLAASSAFTEQTPVASNVVKPEHRRRKRRRNRKKGQWDQDRLRFILENCDSFALAEHQFLYGNNL